MRTRTLLIILSALFIIAIPFVTKTNDNKGPGSVRIFPNINYVEQDPDKEVKQSQLLDLYVPTVSNNTVPLVVFIHGGAWLQGDKNEVKDIAEVLARNGFAVASINYRLTDEAIFPAQIQDCQRAIEFLKAKAKKYGYNADRVGVWGVSAGGHLASLLGTMSGDGHKDETDLDRASHVQAVCDWCGLTDLISVQGQAGSKTRIDYDTTDGPVAKLLGGLPSEKVELATTASPVNYVSKNDPPFLIVHGDIDDLVPFAQSEELSNRLIEAGVPTKFVVVRGAGHNLGSEQEIKRIVEFFKQTLLEGKRDFQVDN